MSLKNTFYCQKICGNNIFSINDWKEQKKLCIDLGIEMPKEDNKKCIKQCIACMAIVGDRQQKTQNLINKKLNQ